MKFAVIDIVFALIIFFFAIRVTIRGFVSEFFSKAAVVLGALCAVLLYKKLAPYIERMLGENVFSDIISFLAIFIAVYAVVKIVQQLVGSAFKGETMTGLDKALGFFFGILEGLLICSVILIILRAQPFFDPEKIISGSFFDRLFSPFLRPPTVWLKNFIENGQLPFVPDSTAGKAG